LKKGGERGGQKKACRQFREKSKVSLDREEKNRETKKRKGENLRQKIFPPSGLKKKNKNRQEKRKVGGKGRGGKKKE